FRPKGCAVSGVIDPTFSFEVLPPRTPAAEASVFEAIDRLCEVNPEFISVTYRPTGHDHAASLAVLGKLIREHRVHAMAHLTCVGYTYDTATRVIRDFLDEGVTNFLALRGDIPPGQSEEDSFPGDLASAGELVQLIHRVQAERSPFSLEEMRGFPSGKKLRSGEKVTIAVAAFPNGHPNSRSRAQDIDTLLAKEAAGANLAITQLFFEADEYLEFVAEAKTAGVTMRMLPGIMPVLSMARLHRIIELTGETMPLQLLAALEAAPDAATMAQVGIDACTRLARDLLAGGADGIHLYTFNRADAPLAVLKGAGLLKTSTQPA
ncbi:MAG: methylenetetrahydrofolate reductase, partial [Rhodoglobus sp.]